MDDYLELAKQYQKQKEKQHHKQQHEAHHEPSMSNVIDDQVLMANEIDYFFWDKLVQLGWRINTEFPLSDKKVSLKSVQFLFLCPDCDKALHSQQSHTITFSKAKTMTDVLWLKSLVTLHKVDSKKGCYPAEYDENGEVISEALPKAESPTKR